MYPNPVQCHETGRRYHLVAGPLRDHAGKEADVEIEEDSADKRENISGLDSRHKRSIPLAMDHAMLPIDARQRLVLGDIKFTCCETRSRCAMFTHSPAHDGPYWWRTRLGFHHSSWFTSTFQEECRRLEASHQRTGLFSQRTHYMSHAFPQAMLTTRMPSMLREEKQSARSRFKGNGVSENLHEAKLGTSAVRLDVQSTTFSSLICKAKSACENGEEWRRE